MAVRTEVFYVEGYGNRKLMKEVAQQIERWAQKNSNFKIISTSHSIVWREKVARKECYALVVYEDNGYVI